MSRGSSTCAVVLVRHGRPDMAGMAPLLSGRRLGGWVGRYDAAGISRAVVPPASLARYVPAWRR